MLLVQGLCREGGPRDTHVRLLATTWESTFLWLEATKYVPAALGNTHNQCPPTLELTPTLSEHKGEKSFNF